MEIENKINNNINIEENKNNFLNNIIGKTINNAFDIGLRAILPDLIENQIIDIKNALLENGLKSGIDTAIKSVIDFRKSATGIITGNFENIGQVRTAIGDGGIIDTISNLLDKTLNKIYEKGNINKSIFTLMKNGKNILLDNISNNIKSELKEQNNLVENLEKHLRNWEENYNKKDFVRMTQEYNKIEKELDKIIPLENVIKETKRVKALHNLIKNNGQNFNITENEERLANNLAS